MALIPFKSTEKQGKANSKSILSLALLMFSLVEPQSITSFLLCKS